MLGAQGFPVRTSPYAASEKDWTDDEADSFMRLLDCSKDVLPSIGPDGLSFPPQRIFRFAGDPGENVKGLYSSRNGFDLALILFELAALGYDCEWSCLNSKDFGVPQSRERVYIVAHKQFSDADGHLGAFRAGKVFSYTPRNEFRGDPEPLGVANPAYLREIIGGHQGARIYDPDGLAVTLTSGAGGFGGKTGLYAVGFNRLDGITKQIDTAYTLLASDAKGLQTNQTQTAVLHPRAVNAIHKERVRQNGHRIKEENEPMFCLTTVDRHGVEIAGRIRRLTPREAFRLRLGRQIV